MILKVVRIWVRGRTEGEGEKPRHGGGLGEELRLGVGDGRAVGGKHGDLGA